MVAVTRSKANKEEHQQLSTENVVPPSVEGVKKRKYKKKKEVDNQLTLPIITTSSIEAAIASISSAFKKFVLLKFS